jgi:hypothetical protein
MGAALVSAVYNRSSKFDMTGSSLDEKRKRARTTLQNLGSKRSSLYTTRLDHNPNVQYAYLK